MSGIKLSFFKKLNAGHLDCVFTLNIVKWEITIVGCKLFIKDENKKWICFPQEKYEARDGTIKYKKLVYFSRDRSHQLLKAIEAEIEAKNYTLYEDDIEAIDEERKEELDKSLSEDDIPF